MRSEREVVGRFADRRQLGRSEQLDRHHAFPLREVQLDDLQEPRQVGHAQDLLGLVAAHEGEHLAVLGSQKLQGSAPERAVPLAQGDDPLHP